MVFKTISTGCLVLASLMLFWDQTKSVWGKLGILGGRTLGSTNVEGGQHLPFQSRPNLTRSLIIISCYVNPHRSLHLLEALHQLMNNNAVGLVKNQESQDRLFLVPKPNNKWRPILYLNLSRQSQQIPQGRKNSKWRHQKQ